MLVSTHHHTIVFREPTLETFKEKLVIEILHPLKDVCEIQAKTSAEVKKLDKKIIKPGDNKIKPGDNKMKPKDGYKGATRPTNGENLRPCAIGCGSSHPHGSLLHCKEYKKLDREGRGKVITKYKLCIKCLRPPPQENMDPM